MPGDSRLGGFSLTALVIGLLCAYAGYEWQTALVIGLVLSMSSTAMVLQTLDEKGYLYAAGKYSVQVIDCETGKLVGEFGSYGNMDCQGIGSESPHPELPFGSISGLSVWKDRLFVVDELNRRIVKCRIIYGQAEEKGP